MYYVKLLVAVQEGKVDQVVKTIEECFPDIDTPVDEVMFTSLLPVV